MLPSQPGDKARKWWGDGRVESVREAEFGEPIPVMRLKLALLVHVRSTNLTGPTECSI
jgi:hypothetical protein